MIPLFALLILIKRIDRRIVRVRRNLVVGKHLIGVLNELQGSRNFDRFNIGLDLVQTVLRLQRHVARGVDLLTGVSFGSLALLRRRRK